MVTSKVLKEIYISEDSDIYNELSPVGKFSFLFDGYIFRGESSKYKLLPSALREDEQSFNKLFEFAGLGGEGGITYTHDQKNHENFYQIAELVALKRFYNLADLKGLNLPDAPFLRGDILNDFTFGSIAKLGDVWIPDEMLEIAALAQHYGVPTRLIDWTVNIFISLYFASIGVIKSGRVDGNMVLYALNYKIIEFLKHTDHKIPLRLVRPDNYRNPNLNYQKGVLSCWSYKTSKIKQFGVDLVDRRSLEVIIQEYVDNNRIRWDDPKVEEQPLIYKFYIPQSKAYEIYNLITKLGYGADSLFTGFDGIVKRIEEDVIYHRTKR
ncbi:FRG domain-containing protein [Bacillus thuringiensis]|uniref:FRG domain-containing protein n=1 Tax=Bacillus thuringiensis TaxID=1428 RepID=UPI000BFD4860|nr:FRG domain-containing protein [Bacillus thuringiensis]PGT51361.1 hypothetical protein COD16_31090 [Bacillus thuringiensis]